MKISYYHLILGALLLATPACVERQPGPAERLGKSIDDFSKGLGDLNDQWSKDSERERDARRDNYSKNRQRDDYSEPYSDSNRDSDRSPDHDPYYDSPPNDSGSDDWRESDPYDRSRKPAARERY